MFTVRWKSARGQTVLGLLVIPLLCLASGAFGQVAPTCNVGSPTGLNSPFGCNDPYHVSYYGNANSGLPSAQVNIVNPGSLAGYSQHDAHPPVGDLCANVYVFVSDQQMTECCSCLITPNGNLQLSVDNDLTANPYTTDPPKAGDIKIVSSAAAGLSCTGTAGLPFAALPYTPAGTLLEWITHSRPTTASLVTVTETAFHPTFLIQQEQQKLVNQCYTIWTNGTGHGRCTCGATPK